MGQVDADGTGAGALPHDDIQGEILHGGVEDFLHIPVQPMDFINEKHIMVLQGGQNGCQLSRPSDGRAAGHFELASQLIGNDFRHGGLSQPRRAVEKHMVQRFLPGFRRCNIYLQVFLKRFLAYVIIQPLGAQGILPLIFRRFLRRNDAALAAQHLFFLLASQTFYILIIHLLLPVFCKFTERGADQLRHIIIGA